MNRLREHVLVERPAPQAQTLLGVFFESRRQPDGTLRMRLRVPVGHHAPLEFALDRDVRVEARLERDEQNLNDVLHVTWHPEGTAMLPVFDGSLIVCATSDPGVSRIDIDGSYVPPLGAVGEAIDEVFGYEIAQSTVREFLYDVKSFIEASPST